MKVATERPLKAQLSTANVLVAMFADQIAEYEGMGAKRRKRTARGKDLTARIDGLREGHGKWTARVADLEARITSGADV